MSSAANEADERTFRSSTPLSIGIELELQLLRQRDLDLARDALDLIARLETCALPGAVKPEITESMIELNSSVHADFPALRDEMRAMRDVVVREAGVLNLRIAGGGSHPFHSWTDRRIYPTERFRALLERYGYLAKQFTVFGQHIHVGCPGGDEAVYLVHMLTRYVPHFIALSAASPYYQGEDTAFQSSRLTSVSAFPLAGTMPFVANWAEFVEYFDRMRGFGIAASMKDFYWDIRPKPQYGTVEIRVCDTPLTVERAAQLAAYAQALAAHHLAERPHQPARAVYLVDRYNRFEASRFGLKGELVEPYLGVKKRIGDDVLETIAELMPIAGAQGCAEALAGLAEDVRRGYSDADWLRERYAQTGDLADVVRDASRRWSAESGAS